MKLTFALSLIIYISTVPLAHSFLIGGESANKDSLRATVWLNKSCTASKVGPKTFLTAGHCVFGDSQGRLLADYLPGRKITIATHYDVKKRVTVDEVHSHETYVNFIQDRIRNGKSTSAGALVAFDIALISVTDETNDIEIAEPDYEPVLNDETIILSGYGCTTNTIKKSGSGTYKMAMAKVVPSNVIERDIYKRDITRAHEFNFYSEGKSLNKNAASICPGDSGGPVYREKDRTIIGVNSQYIFKDRTGLSYVNTHTRLSAVADWAQALIK